MNKLITLFTFGECPQNCVLLYRFFVRNAVRKPLLKRWLAQFRSAEALSIKLTKGIPVAADEGTELHTCLPN